MTTFRNPSNVSPEMQSVLQKYYSGAPAQQYSSVPAAAPMTATQPNFRNAPQAPTYAQRDNRVSNSIENLYRDIGDSTWQQQDALRNGQTNQQQAQNYVQGLISQQNDLQNRANSQIEDRQQISENLFAGLLEGMQDDKTFGYIRSAINQWLQNPGMSNRTLNRLRGQANARAAADVASRNRQIDRSASRNNLRGAVVDDARQASRSRGNANLNRALLDIDLRNQDLIRSDRGNAVRAAGSFTNSYYGNLGNMANRYAGLLTSYNPQVAPLNVYDAMQQIYANPTYGA